MMEQSVSLVCMKHGYSLDSTSLWRSIGSTRPNAKQLSALATEGHSWN